ncbi:hypothetical protein [Flammeovirga aprica]|uniref:Uncharacterized protein n=1 Tax=Flammeovirga aprica JL-4 TaxID=694437 RepID=A0A7X9RS88_9BACT|nr:hypothetical protein [Flammeovirga aprica]NME66736.1 hypothetical protein [Flammeovirga aprica JL-4]
MKNFILLLIVLVAGSCKTEEDLFCCAVDDVGYSFSLINEKGEDLLNKNTPGTLNSSNNIRLYRLDTENNESSNYPRMGYSINDHDGLNKISLSFGATNDDLIVRGIIEWSENDRDTIVLENIQAYKNVKVLVKITYNGKVVWDANKENNSGIRYFQIVK